MGKRIVIFGLGLLMIGCNVLNTTLDKLVNDESLCPVSPRLPDHPQAAIMTAPVGEYPVWFVTVDVTDMSLLGASLPPYNGGTVRKSLLVVSTDVAGDLTITGHQLDGDGEVLFPTHIDEEIENEDGSTTIVYSEDDLTAQFVVPNAHVTTFGPNRDGYATHPWAVYYPNPGCYELTGTYGGYSTSIVVEVLDT